MRQYCLNEFFPISISAVRSCILQSSCTGFRLGGRDREFGVDICHPSTIKGDVKGSRETTHNYCCVGSDHTLRRVICLQPNTTKTKALSTQHTHRMRRAHIALVKENSFVSFCSFRRDCCLPMLLDRIMQSLRSRLFCSCPLPASSAAAATSMRCKLSSSFHSRPR